MNNLTIIENRNRFRLKLSRKWLFFILFFLFAVNNNKTLTPGSDSDFTLADFDMKNSNLTQKKVSTFTTYKPFTTV